MPGQEGMLIRQVKKKPELAVHNHININVLNLDSPIGTAW